MHDPRPRFFATLLLASVVCSSAAWADLPLGARCKNSNQCATKRCSGDVCKTGRGTTTYYADGASCNKSGECASNKCINSVCGGPKKKAPSGGGSTGPSDSDNEPSGGGKPFGGGLSGNMIIPETTTACGKDLVDGKYYTDPIMARIDAEGACYYFKQEAIDKAKAMKDSGMGTFENILTVITSSPELIKCANDEYGKLSAADKKKIGLVLSDACRGPDPVGVGPRDSPAVLACAKDLRAGGFIPNDDEEKYVQMNAELVCENSPQTDIDLAKKVFKELPGASMTEILKATYLATPTQIDCAKKEFKALSPEDRKAKGFEMPATCKARSPYLK